MKSREDIVKTLTAGKPALSKKFKIRSMALFGSFARGDAGPDSDVDILVDVDPSIGLEFVSLAERIQEALGLPVDLVSSRAVKPAYRKEIESELIYV